MRGVRVVPGRERGAVVKRAQLVAEAVAVLCPECGDAQPNRHGSEMWTLEDFKARTSWLATQRRVADRSHGFTCVSCDARFLVTADSKVMFR